MPSLWDDFIRHITTGNVAALHSLKMKGLFNVRSLDYNNHEAVREAIKSNQVRVLQFFKQWVDTDEHGKSRRLTLMDLRHNDHRLLREAARAEKVEVLKFFKEWRDQPEMPGLTVEDLRAGHNECIRFAAHSGHVEVLIFLRDWVTPLLDGTLDRLSVQDLRVHDNEALKNAIASNCIPVLQVLKDWARDTKTSAQWTLADLDMSNNWAWAEAERRGLTAICEFMKTWENELRAAMPASTPNAIDFALLQTTITQFVHAVPDNTLTDYPVLLAVSKAVKKSQ